MSGLEQGGHDYHFLDIIDEEAKFGFARGRIHRTDVLDASE